MIDVIPGYPHALVDKRKGRKARFYFRYGDGPQVDILYEPGSREFDKLYQSLLQIHKDGLEPKSKRQRRSDVLPYNLPPRGLSREETAAYVGISEGLFDRMVEEGKLPQPLEFGRRNVFDRWKINEALTRLSMEAEEAAENEKTGVFRLKHSELMSLTFCQTLHYPAAQGIEGMQAAAFVLDPKHKSARSPASHRHLARRLDPETPALTTRTVPDDPL